MPGETSSLMRISGVVGRRILTVVVWCGCIGLLVFLLARIAMQIAVPPPPPKLRLVEDIPLPSAMPDKFRTPQNPLAPGLALAFDHFDFQSLDPQTHLLFIAHTGPSPDREQQINPKFNPDTDAKTDGNVIVFDTVEKRVVGLVNIPQVAGIVVAPDLHKVYAADANDNIVYVINEATLQASPIKLQNNDGPDGVEYDQRDHLIFVSDPGSPSNPDQSQIIERKNQNETIINALTDKVVARIELGIDGKWGDDVGHVRFDPGLDRAYVPVQQLPYPDDPNPNLLPPPGTSYLVEFDPLTHRVVTRLKLPYDCLTPHGLAVDPVQHIGFVACVDEDPPSLYRIDLRTMRVMNERPWVIPVNPDLIVLDYSLHLVYVGCGAGIAIFQENGRGFKWLGDYIFGANTHTIAVNQATHEVYVPLVRVGGRPVLRILRYIA
jgi:DNA-binding beta-propeller fold protein YncE